MTTLYDPGGYGTRTFFASALRVCLADIAFAGIGGVFSSALMILASNSARGTLGDSAHGTRAYPV